MLVMPIALYSASQGIPKNSKVFMKSSQAQFSYVGNVNEAGGGGKAIYLGLGVSVAIDTTIGLRYELFAGDNMVHTATYYKFSNPTQAVMYSYKTHKSSIIYYTNVTDSDPGVEVVGKDYQHVGSKYSDSLLCTHLQHGAGTNEVTNYWMSPYLPGFSQLANTLNHISPLLASRAFSGNVFRWGGLVRWTIDYLNPKTGETFNMELHLEYVNPNPMLQPSTFEVPTK